MNRIAPPVLRRATWDPFSHRGRQASGSALNRPFTFEKLGQTQKLPKIINIYRPKQEAMLNALEKYFPDSFRWSKPEGGMFLWAEGPEGLDMERIYWKSIKKKAAFVTGKFFFTRKGEGIETM